MRKIFAIGTLLLSSAAVLVIPAAASDRNDYGYKAPQSYQVHTSYPVHESYRARVDRERRERLERERQERERRDHDLRFHQNDRYDGYGRR